MNPLDFAMQMELEGREFYLKQAEAVQNKQMAVVFRNLADDELKHYEIVKSMKETGRYGNMESNILEKVKNVFAEPLEKGESIDVESFQEVYKAALEFEEKSIDLYSDLAAKAVTTYEQEVFTRLAKEEEMHRAIFWRLNELLQRPEEWYPYLDF